MYKSYGKLTFDPLPLSGNKSVMFKPWWIILQMTDDTDNYYRWFIEKRYGLKLQRPAWGGHISIVRGETTSQENWNIFKTKYDGKEIEFEHSGEIRTNGNHWWLRTYCDNLKDFREEMGYPRDGLWGLHLTIGVPIPLHLQHSFYLWDCIRRFELNEIDIDWKTEMELKNSINEQIRITKS